MASTIAYPSIMKEGVAEVAELNKTDKVGDVDKAAEEVVGHEVAKPPKK